jgi:hypothetical protein
VVEGRPQALALLDRWLILHPEANRAAQDIRPCDANSLKELFTYFTKVVVKRPDASAPRALAPVEALDVMFRAMKGRRVYQPMGFKAAVEPGADENAEVGTSGDTQATKRIGEALAWDWIQSATDWVDLDTGELLTGYEPTEALRRLVPAQDAR